MTKQLQYHVHVQDEDGSNHVFGPGDDVPAWARKKITNPGAWADESDSDDDSDDDEDQPLAYASMKKADLEAEVAKRNEAREDADHIEVGGTGTKADLVAALEADDEALAG